MVTGVGSSLLSIQLLARCWPCALISDGRSGSAYFPRSSASGACHPCRSCCLQAAWPLVPLEKFEEPVSAVGVPEQLSGGDVFWLHCQLLLCWPSRAPGASWGHAGSCSAAGFEEKQEPMGDVLPSAVYTRWRAQVCSHVAGAALVAVWWWFTAAWVPRRKGRAAAGLQLHYCWVHKESSSSGVPVTYHYCVW